MPTWLRKSGQRGEGTEEQYFFSKKCQFSPVPSMDSGTGILQNPRKEINFRENKTAPAGIYIAAWESKNALKMHEGHTPLLIKQLPTRNLSCAVRNAHIYVPEMDAACGILGF